MIRPKVLLLDEPTAALDPASVAAVETLIATQIRAGLGVLWVTHDEEQAGRIACRQPVVEAGRVWEEAGVTSYITFSYWDLALASVLVLIDAGLSIIFGLKIHRSLLVAAARMAVQLTVGGLGTDGSVLACLAAVDGCGSTRMIFFAGQEVTQRQDRRLSGWWSFGLGTGCMMISSVVVTAFALLTAFRPTPWYDPRYAIPLLGMILGNCMTGIALGLHTLTTSLVRRRASVEAQLMLGATRWDASAPVTRAALRSALMPTINSMSATGLVSLAGMMTGQILGGVPPVEAVKYEILSCS